MCSRFVSKDDLKKVGATFRATRIVPDFYEPSHNVAPTDFVPIILEDKDQERELILARFGMTITVEGKTRPLTNLQSEKAANRQDFKTRRCVIPANGFYEWEKISPKDKQPYYFSPKEGMFAFAGIWKQDAKGAAFSIFTTTANETVGKVHNRMPVILGHNEMPLWLAANTESDTLVSMLQPLADSAMQIWPVSKEVNHVKNKAASCINSI